MNVFIQTLRRLIVALAFGRRVWCGLSLLILLSVSAKAQVVNSLASFSVTNYTGDIIAGDTNAGGRQAIQTLTAMTYSDNTDTTSSPGTNYVELVYRLLDSNGVPVQILDQTGNPNTAYTIYQTNVLPRLVFVPPAFHIAVNTNYITNNVPLQPVVALNPYELYSPQLTIYQEIPPGATFGPTGLASNLPGDLFYFDFTNTVSPDPLPNILADLSGVSLLRTWSINNSPNQSGFPVQVSAAVSRYDDYTLPPYSTNTTVTFNFQLINATTGTPVPLQSSNAVFVVSLESHDPSSPPNPVNSNVFTNFSLVPAVQLDSVDDTYRIVVTLSHTDGGAVVMDATNTSAAMQLLAFNGQLDFGPFATLFTNLDTTPLAFPPGGGSLPCILYVTLDSGLLPGAPGQSYGDGSGIPVNLLPNGTAQFTGPSPILLNDQNGGGNNQTASNISYHSTPIALSSAGATENVTLTLPVGMGFNSWGSGSRLLASTLTFNGISLGNNLGLPASLTFNGPFQIACENLPYGFEAPSIQWNIYAGNLTAALTGGAFARENEDAQLTAAVANLVEPNDCNRVSNDGYFRNAAPASGVPLVVRADANGLALVSCQLALDPPELRPHFPYTANTPGQQILLALNGGSSSGSFVLSNNNVVSTSYLSVQTPMPVPYGRDTSETNCSASLAGPGMLEFTPANINHQLGFTADGGLLAAGSVPSGSLTWGYVGKGNYAQSVLNIGPCNYEMAGLWLPIGQDYVDSTELPAELLFSGFGNGTNLTYVERLGETIYQTAGLANYPGMNFIAPATGASYLAGSASVSFQLASDAKYYARWSGVSGIHDTLMFPQTSLVLYGYNFTFSSYRLAFLDSEVVDSITAGSLYLPGPSSFTQPFTNLLFSGLGYLESANVPPNSGLEHMYYWNTDIRPESIQFQPNVGDSCGTGNRTLVLGVETKLPFIPQELHASLGFKSNGNLATLADAVSGCDSRFPVPAQLSLQGPGSSSFVLSTASEGYFNSYQTPGAPPQGFYNLVGKIRVPFFEDVSVHLHIYPITPSGAQVMIMGGWPDPATGVKNEGWNEGSQNYFNTAKFDPTAESFPQDEGIQIMAYEQSQTAMYHPVAQRNWIQVAVFDYPLQWNPQPRNFSGYQVEKVTLPVINVDSKLKEISPGKVDFDFAQDVSLQLPVVKVLDLVNDAVGEADGSLLDLSNAVQNALGTVFDTAGLNELSGLLREDTTTLLQPILNTALNNVVNQLYTQLSSYPQTDKSAFLNNAYSQVTSISGLLSNAVQNATGAPSQANSVLGKVDQTLADVQKDVGQFVQILDPNSGQDPISGIIKNLISDQAGGLGSLVGSSLDSSIQTLVSGLKPTLGDLESEFATLTNQFYQARQSLTNPNSDFGKAMSEMNSDSASIQQFVQMAAMNVTNMLASSLTPAGDYFTANPAAAKQAIEQQLANAFANSQLTSDFQSNLRQFLFDDNATMDELMDDTFDQINGAIRDGLQSVISSADTNFIPGKIPAILNAKIRGSPTFNGDSLRKIHLNADVKLKIPTDMNFNAYMEIKELTSQTVPEDCIPAGPPAAEVTLGCKNVNLDWLALNDSDTPLTLTVAAKWTLQDKNVIGVGGLFDIKGEIGFQGCSANELGATLFVGVDPAESNALTEIYFACKAAGTINVLGVPVGVQMGVFVGKSCSLQPILFIDPLASDVLGSIGLQSFEGIYVEGDASLSLSEILFGTSSCELDVGYTLSEAIFYEGNLTTMNIGSRQTAQIDASLLCLISASAGLTMYDIYSANLSAGSFGFTMGGDASLCGSIGPCPFCISGCKTLGISATVGTGGINYHVSY